MLEPDIVSVEELILGKNLVSQGLGISSVETRLFGKKTLIRLKGSAWHLSLRTAFVRHLC